MSDPSPPDKPAIHPAPKADQKPVSEQPHSEAKSERSDGSDDLDIDDFAAELDAGLEPVDENSRAGDDAEGDFSDSSDFDDD